MKCIRNNETFEIRRIRDRDAQIRVSSGKWSYCQKADWKKQKNGVAPEKIYEEFLANQEKANLANLKTIATNVATYDLPSEPTTPVVTE